MANIDFKTLRENCNPVLVMRTLEIPTPCAGRLLCTQSAPFWGASLKCSICIWWMKARSLFFVQSTLHICPRSAAVVYWLLRVRILDLQIRHAFLHIYLRRHALCACTGRPYTLCWKARVYTICQVLRCSSQVRYLHMMDEGTVEMFFWQSTLHICPWSAAVVYCPFKCNCSM